MPRLVIYFIGLLFVFNVVLTDKIENNETDEDQKFKRSVEKELEGPWRWPWARNTTTTKAITTTKTTKTTTPPDSYTTVKPHKYKLKPKTRKSLKMALRGTTPEQRKKQLKQLGKTVKIEKISKAESKKLHKSYKKVKVNQKQPELDMFEINERAGLNAYLFQGDMNLDDAQIAEMMPSSKPRTKRQIRNSQNYWTDKTVKYYFEPGFLSSGQQTVRDAMDLIESKTCIKFVQNETAENKVRIIDGDGCYSNVGMLGGEQTLSLGNGCKTVGVAAHEIGHTLGIRHTHMRSDRDDYITVDVTDVEEDNKYNFLKMTPEESTNLVTYEYGSYLHYSARSFVNSGGVDAIVPKDPTMLYSMGTRIVTFNDFKLMNIHYSCTCPSTLPCEHGGYANPAKCGECICPYGFAGTLCTERQDDGCGGELTATHEWQQQNYSLGSPAINGKARPMHTYCTHWIKAPAGKQIQFRIDDGYETECNYGCVYNGIEPKLKPDMTMTQARYCCSEFHNEVMYSETNPLPIFTYNRYDTTIYAWSYRYIACVDLLDTASCLVLKAEKEKGCSPYDDAQLKAMCAVTFGFCGKSVSGATCKDRYSQSECGSFSTNKICTSLNPLVAEYSCAATCGFCNNPV